MLSQRFAPVSGHCASCKRLTAGPVYLNLNSRDCLCVDCFMMRGLSEPQRA